MLAYQDLHGSLDANGNLGMPNGQIADKEDLDQLCKNNKTYGFTTKLGIKLEGTFLECANLNFMGWYSHN